jgi:uncharacterized membrane protein HdeD (DUF308 family)
MGRPADNFSGIPRLVISNTEFRGGGMSHATPPTMANIQEVQSEFGRSIFPGPELTRRWGLLLALGALLVLVGFLALGSSFVATMASVLFFGALMIAGGITEVVLAFSGKGWQGTALHLLMGVLAAVAGFLMLRAPLMGASALTLLIAAWLLVSGVGQAIHAAIDRTRLWGLSVASGIIAALLGLMLIGQWPVSSLWFIGVYMGVRFICEGVTWVALALAVRSHASRLGPPMRPHLAT